MAGTMTTEAKKARADYIRQWRRDHPEKDREYKARYWQKKAEQAAKESEGGEHGSE